MRFGPGAAHSVRSLRYEVRRRAGEGEGEGGGAALVVLKSRGLHLAREKKWNGIPMFDFDTFLGL